MLHIQKIEHKESAASVTHLITDHRLLMTAALALALSGCMGVYDGGFECPPGEGVGCKSISEVNQMVNEGELPKKENGSDSKPCEQCSSNPQFQKDIEELHIWYSPWALGTI
ncbi:MAG: hypothetical protein KBD36_03145 [Alphaproteobacteria bacterium]|nr:hypothetical protein [Alphaproteobacteria bacterium]MBP9776821.1 hypothetical protein [Alphaproteobacteria bacterium]